MTISKAKQPLYIVLSIVFGLCWYITAVSIGFQTNKHDTIMCIVYCMLSTIGFIYFIKQWEKTSKLISDNEDNIILNELVTFSDPELVDQYYMLYFKMDKTLLDKKKIDRYTKEMTNRFIETHKFGRPVLNKRVINIASPNNGTGSI